MKNKSEIITNALILLTIMVVLLGILNIFFNLSLKENIIIGGVSLAFFGIISLWDTISKTKQDNLYRILVVAIIGCVFGSIITLLLDAIFNFSSTNKFGIVCGFISSIISIIYFQKLFKDNESLDE